MRRGVLVLAAAGVCAFTTILRAEPAPFAVAISPQLAELQRSLAGITSVQSDFVEEKHLSVLQQAVLIKGHLAIQNPGLFSWQVTEPLRFNLLVDGTTLRQWDEATGETQEMSMAGNPVFGIITTQLRGWFSGQLESLLADFDAVADTSAPAPTITFTPRETSVADKVIRRVTLTFREDRRYIREITIEERNGDWTSMTFMNTVLNAAIDPTQWEVKPLGR